MSARFVAHVRLADGQVEDVDCESAFVEDGVLWLKREHDGEFTVFACYQHPGWISYRIEAAPEPVTEEQLMSGEKSLNDYRRSLGFHASCAALHTDHQGNPIPCPDAAPGSDAVDWPAIGDLVHVRFGTEVCVPGRIEEAPGITVLIDCSVGEPKFGQLMTAIHDESRQVDGSWHWPHDAGAASQAAPASPAPITVNVTVQGGVVTDKQLQDTIAQHLSRIAAMRGLRS